MDEVRPPLADAAEAVHSRSDDAVLGAVGEEARRVGVSNEVDARKRWMFTFIICTREPVVAVEVHGEVEKGDLALARAVLLAVQSQEVRVDAADAVDFVGAVDVALEHRVVAREQIVNESCREAEVPQQFDLVRVDVFEYDEEDFVRRALQCRNGIGLAGGGLRHEVVGEVL